MDPAISRKLAKAAEAASAELQSFVEKRCRVLCSMRTEDSKMQYINSARCKKLYPLIDKYMRASLNELSARLLALPRELRDLVYDFVWSDWRNAVGPLLHHYAHRREAFIYSEISAISLQFVPNIARADRISRRIIHEASEQLKRQLAVSPRTGSPAVTTISIEAIPEFIGGNYFHVGVSHEQLCRVSDLRIRFDRYITRLGCRLCTPRELLARGLDGRLDLLLTLPFQSATYARGSIYQRPRAIIFDFFEIDRMSHDSLSFVLQNISRVFHELKAKGFDVRLSYTVAALDMTVTLEASAWQWTRVQWSNKLFHEAHSVESQRTLYAFGALSRLGADQLPATMPMFFEHQTPIWNAIMHDLYRVGEYSSQRGIFG